VFSASIQWLADQGITQGCNPPANTKYCPNDYVTRGQMAAFIVRAKGYSYIAADYFIDDNNNVFEGAINKLRTAGVTQGCNPPTNNHYCPDQYVTRGQMAAFLVRAFNYTNPGVIDYFNDDNNSVFEAAINKLRTAGVTQGCNPPTNNHYCPNDNVTRGQMASFLKRAISG
jgi:S-layer homology domain